MGTKFGNFSVLGIDIDEVLKLLKKIPIYDTSLEQFDKALKKAYPNEVHEERSKEQSETLSAILRMASNSKKTYYAGKNGKWITVYNEWFGWGSVEQAALEFSKLSSNLCFSISMFDADIFTLTIFQAGNILTQHIDSDVEEYNSKSIKGDIDIIADSFNIPEKKSELKKVMAGKNLENKVEDMEKLFSMKLWGFNLNSVKKMKWEKVNFGVDEQELINGLPPQIADIFKQAKQNSDNR